MRLNPYTCAVLLITGVFVSGCATAPPPSRVVVDDPSTMVRLVVDSGIDGPNDPARYAHPADVNAGQLQSIFDAIRLQPQRLSFQKRFKGDTASQRVFEASEIAALAPIVTDALSQASSMERVVFALTQPTGNGKAATVGEMYVKDQQLHFILHCHQRPTQDSDVVSSCQSQVAPQGFELSFTQAEGFVGFGKSGLFLGNSTKELVIDYSKIQPAAGS